MPETVESVRTLISSRLAEIDAEAMSLERAIAGLGRSAPKRRRGRPRKRNTTAAVPAAAKPKRGLARKRKSARAPRGRRREQLLAAIDANPGAKASDLAKAIGIPATQVHALIAKARAEKVIIKRGKGYAFRA